MTEARHQFLEVGPASISRVLSVVASFLLTVAIARLLGASASGSFFLVLTGLAVFATAGRLGTDNLALKLGAGETEVARMAVARLIGSCAGASAVAALGAYGAYLLTASRISNLPSSLGFVVASSVIPQALSVVAGAVLRTRGKLVVGTLAELGSPSVVALLIVAGFAAGGRATLSSALTALSIASWATAAWAVPAAIVVARPQQNAWHAIQTAHFVRVHVRQLVPMMGTSLLFLALTWAPIFVLGFTTGPSEVGYYATAARLAAVITLIPSIQISYLAPAFARLYHRGQLATLNTLCNSAAWQATAIATLPALCLIVLPSIVIRIAYGPDFLAAALPLSLLTIAALFGVAAGQVNQLMLLCDLEHMALVLNLGWLAGWAFVGLWTSSVAGASGAAGFTLATAVAYASIAAYSLAQRRGIISFVRFPVQFAAART